jgi:hypothetical protein
LRRPGKETLWQLLASDCHRALRLLMYFSRAQMAIGVVASMPCLSITVEGARTTSFF